MRIWEKRRVDEAMREWKKKVILEVPFKPFLPPRTGMAKRGLHT